MITDEYASAKIAEAFRKRFGDQVKSINVKMKYTREVREFIRQAEAAHKATANSKLIFR